MKTPKSLLQDFVIVPVFRFHKKFLSRGAQNEFCNKLANFIFKYSQETDIIMLFFNAVGVFSSHLSQIGGLKKSDRENKDYLINQEKQELGLELALSIVPPFLINRFLKLKLESGQWATKESRDKLINLVAPIVGASRDELYSTDHIRPIKESIGILIRQINGIILKKDKNMSPSRKHNLINFDNKIKSKLPDPVTVFNQPSTEVIATDCDNMIRKKRVSNKLQEHLRNHSAYDELCGQTNGIVILATIGYLILTSNVIMPILKNKLSNRAFEKELAEKGETKESIKRKKRFNVLEDGFPIDNFIQPDKISSDGKQDDIFNMEKQKEPLKTRPIFDNFITYGNTASQSNGLRI